MPTADLGGYEGPRRARADEWDACQELSRSIFFPEARTYVERAVTWPMALLPEFQENTLVIFHEGRPVSLIGRLERGISVYGVPLRFGYIGGVCTHLEHRGKGLAGAIQSASFRIFREHGVDFIYISGTRPMYYGAGANHIGGFRRFTVPAGLVGAPAVRLRRAAAADVALLGRLNEGDAVRFLRPPSDYEHMLRYGHAAGQPCEFHIVETAGVPVASLFLTRPEGDGRRSVYVHEVRGERMAALAGLSSLANEADAVQVQVAREDVLGHLLAAEGVPAEAGRTSGTVKALDFCATMERLRPYFAGRLGAAAAASLRFVDAGTRTLVLSDAGTLTIDGECNLLWTLLGAPAGEEVQGVSAAGVGAALLSECLPLPWPSVHLNMI